MRRPFSSLLSFFLVVSCHSGAGKHPEQVSVSDSPAIVQPAAKIYVEKALLERSGYTMKGLAFYRDDGKGSGEFDSAGAFLGYALAVENHAARKVDTLTIDSASDASDLFLEVHDVTDSVLFPPLLVEVVTSGSSDYEFSAFCGYRDGALKVLFTVDGYSRATLKRKDEWTLVGYVSRRDKLVGSFEDFPVEVSLKDYTVRYPTPEKLYIGMDSEVLEPFKVTLISSSAKKGKDFILNKGTKIVIDTLYNTSGMVLLILPDKDTVVAHTNEVKGKVEEDAAG